MSDSEPLCPYCNEPAVLRSRMSRYRRGDRTVEVEVRYWECPGACADPDGDTPFRFEDPDLLRANDEAARAAWRARYGEEMPAAKRPGRKTAEKRTERVPVMLTPSEVQRLDRARGDLPRSDFLRDHAFGTSSRSRAPGFPLVEGADPNGPHRKAG